MADAEFPRRPLLRRVLERRPIPDDYRPREAGCVPGIELDAPDSRAMNEIDTTSHRTAEMRTGEYIDLRKLGERVPRRPLDDIASLVQGLTYGEMMELAEVLWKVQPGDRLSRRKIYQYCSIVGQNPTRPPPRSWKSRALSEAKKLAREVIVTTGDVRFEAGWHLLQGLLPPPRNEPPAHREEFGGAAGGRRHDLDGVRRRDIVVGLQIAGRAVREIVQILDIIPRVALDKSPAHAVISPPR
jgi:hypothetical protein